MTEIHGTGCLPCPGDAKGNSTLDELLGAGAIIAPLQLDLTHLIGAILDQGSPGTCVGFGVKRAVETCARQNGHPNLPDLSALQVYKQARGISRMSGDPIDGTTTSAALFGLERGGFLYDSEMPYRPAERWGGMKLGQGQKGLRRAGVKHHRLVELPGPSLKEAIRTVLASGKGLVGGWKVNQAFRDWRPSQGPFAGVSGGPVEGHCMHVLDYPKGNPRIVNSWGWQVGDHGLWTVTWEFLMKAMSLWAVDFVPKV